ncbi:MAG: HlyD family efflux transporter periplasmic adaptor subunit [Mariprofundaceae bacterium]
MSIKSLLKAVTQQRSSMILLIGVSMIMLLVGGSFLFSNTSGEQSLQQVQAAKVIRQSFDLEVVERGVIRPANIVPVQSNISSNQAKLVWLLPEGTEVKKGEMIARFDTKPFQDKLDIAKQDLIDSEARLMAAEKAVHLKKEENAGKHEAAKQELEIARIKAKDKKEGSSRLKRSQLEQQKRKIKRQYQVTKDELRDFKSMLNKGHVSRREYDKIDNQFQSIQEELSLAEAELKNFETYEWPRMVREAELVIQAAQDGLSRVKRTAILEVERLQAEVTKHRRDVAAFRLRKQKAGSDLIHCNVAAPAKGVLLYSELPRPEGRRKIQVGDAIWVGQRFMEIPDTSAVVIAIQIREIDIAKIEKGMEAFIVLDAVQGKRYSGRVESIERLAREDEEITGLRYFQSRIVFHKPDTDVHVGMSATATIRYRHYEQVLTLPVHAIHYQDGLPIVRKAGEEGVNYPVEIGGAGLLWVEIVSGLHEGEQVLAGSF